MLYFAARKIYISLWVYIQLFGQQNNIQLFWATIGIILRPLD